LPKAVRHSAPREGGPAKPDPEDALHLSTAIGDRPFSFLHRFDRLPQSAIRILQRPPPAVAARYVPK